MGKEVLLIRITCRERALKCIKLILITIYCIIILAGIIKSKLCQLAEIIDYKLRKLRILIELWILILLSFFKNIHEILFILIFYL